jgi:trans-aconitate 2-methyltransferase
MADWSAQQYLKFEDDRTRPSRDLLAQIAIEAPRTVVDLGCGPGNSTELLVKRWPKAKVIGMDSSPDMLAKARARLPQTQFEQADIVTWSPPANTDVIFANAVFQWVPDHLAQLVRLFKALPEGGTLAVQMPDNLDEPSHVLMRETARQPQFQHLLADALHARDNLPKRDVYYDAFCGMSRDVQVWHTIYNHSLENAEAIVEWVKSTGLRPFIDPLNANEQKEFLHLYTGYVASAYLPRADGRVLLSFPRLFIMAVKR